MPQQGQSAGHSAEHSGKSMGQKADGRQLVESTSGMGLSGLSDSDSEPPVRKRRKLRAGTEPSDDEWEAVTTAAFARMADPEDPMGELVSSPRLVRLSIITLATVIDPLQLWGLLSFPIALL